MKITLKFACGCTEFVESHIGSGELEVKHICATCALRNMEREILAKRISAFLEKYGKRDRSAPEFWNSPDGAEMEMAAGILARAKNPSRVPWSDWGSGGYGPYTSVEGRTEHAELLRLIKEVISK